MLTEPKRVFPDDVATAGVSYSILMREGTVCCKVSLSAGTASGRLGVRSRVEYCAFSTYAKENRCVPLELC